MIELSVDAADRAGAPPLVPAAPCAPPEAVLDVAHLVRMTLGDHSLQAEVLALFDRQAELLLARMLDAAPEAVAPLAHTLQGSARGIGAWQVARAAEAVELASGRRDPAILPRALMRLAAAVDEARAAVAAQLARR